MLLSIRGYIIYWGRVRDVWLCEYLDAWQESDRRLALHHLHTAMVAHMIESIVRIQTREYVISTDNDRIRVLQIIHTTIEYVISSDIHTKPPSQSQPSPSPPFTQW